eukprot:scaffold279313_cov48-Tisochrysis_lutea.AAC.1
MVFYSRKAELCLGARHLSSVDMQARTMRVLHGHGRSAKKKRRVSSEARIWRAWTTMGIHHPHR